MKLIHKILLTLALLAAIIQAWFIYSDHKQITQITMAASGSGDSFKMAEAIAEVVHNIYPKTQIKIRSTAGSVESMSLLDSDDVDFAMVQADTEATNKAQLVSILYYDLFQIFVRQDSDIQDISGIIGKKIAIAKSTSGQYKSFWSLMHHYGILEKDVTAISMSKAAADVAFLAGEVDAVFRIAPPGSDSIKVLNKQTPIRALPITQAKAIRLTEPALHAQSIPKGAYSGHPAIPDTAIPTLASNRLLIARNSTDNEIVRQVTEILFENRQELQERIKLAGFISQPDRTKGTAIPLHDGAVQFYDRETPTFLQENAEMLALLLTLLAVPFSGLLQLRKKSQQKLIKEYNNTLLDYIKKAEDENDKETLETMAREVNDILIQATHDRNNDKILAEDFDLFSFIWTMARDEVNESLNHRQA
jgi:TRAP transporter TAXI family solute receptor